MKAVNDAAASGEPAASLGSVAVQTLATQVGRRLIRSILRGDFEAGDTLPSENTLARQFDVSRPVVREAVKEAEMLGLVERRQGRQTRVAPAEEWRHLAPELLAARTEAGEIEDLMLEVLELRRMVELEAAALAARRRTRDDLDRMADYLKRMDADLLAEPELFAQHDIGFHDAVLHATRNNLLRPLYVQLRPLLEFGRQVSAQARKEGRARSQLGHRAVYEAIAAGDPDRAREAMGEHLSWTGRLQLADREARLTVKQPPRSARSPRKSTKRHSLG